MVGTDGVNIEIIPTERGDAARNIKSALLLLEHILKNKKKKAVFFIDECQEIGVVASSKGIEGAIRHVAQETHYLRFIFSGSNRHMLSQMFDNRSRPLYKLCDRITIDRIHQDDYYKFIQNIAKNKWGATFEESVIRKIFELTELHPYYMNALCGRILDSYEEKIPMRPIQVEKVWLAYCEEEKSQTAKELFTLSDLQKKIIINIALGNDQLLTGKESLNLLNATSAAVVKAINSLQQKDYIFQTNSNGGYNLIDPLIKTTIKLHYNNVFQ